MKRAPGSMTGLLAVVLPGMGAAFALIGAVFAGLGVRVKGGSPWFFAALGLALLGAGGVCALVRCGQRKEQTRLRAEGVPLPGRVLEVQRHPFITWNVDNLTTLPGQHSPWSVRCGYTLGGREYVVTSEWLWQEPLADSPGLTVYADPSRPGRAWVDPDTLRCRWNG